MWLVSGSADASISSMARCDRWTPRGVSADWTASWLLAWQPTDGGTLVSCLLAADRKSLADGTKVEPELVSVGWLVFP